MCANQLLEWRACFNAEPALESKPRANVTDTGEVKQFGEVAREAVDGRPTWRLDDEFTIVAPLDLQKLADLVSSNVPQDVVRVVDACGSNGSGGPMATSGSDASSSGF